MRRLFSTFAPGWPGAGLLLMRVVGGISLITRALTALQSRQLIVDVLAIPSGILLLGGLWTPIAGSLAAILGLWNAISHAKDPWAGIFLATIGAALALLGPGAWSIDARLFGWKRIDVDRDSKF